MRAPPAVVHPVTNADVNAASTSECLQMLLAASKCVSSEPETDDVLGTRVSLSLLSIVHTAWCHSRM